MKRDWDVVIAGGGMVGASLALALSRHSGGALDVLVVESFPLQASDATTPRHRPSFDARSTALSWGSRQILERLSLWPLLARHLTPITDIHVSDRGHLGSAVLSGADQGWPALGYVVENAWLGEVLLSQLREAPGVELCSPATVAEVAIGVDTAGLQLQRDGQHQSLDCQLLVVADGADSGLRRQLGVVADVRDYRQHAVIANVGFDRPHRGRAYERFGEQGPLGLLPLADSERGEPRGALIWALPEAEAERLQALEERAFLDELQARFGYRQGLFTRVGQRASYPLRLVESREQVRRHLAFVGNAAHALHPVAGQGFNLALRDISRLSRLLAAANARGEPLGELALLRRFVDHQQRDQRHTVMLSHALPRLFGSRRPVLSLLRNLGLLALDVVPPARSRFARQAAGAAPGMEMGHGR